MTIGERIKQRREELGLSVEEVARLLGKHRATIYRYESNEIEKFPTDTLEPIAKALHTTPAYLMGWEDSQNVQVGAVHTNNGLIGQANAPVNINGEVAQLSKEESELLRIYRALGVKERMRLLTTAMDLETEELSK